MFLPVRRTWSTGPTGMAQTLLPLQSHSIICMPTNHGLLTTKKWFTTSIAQLTNKIKEESQLLP